MEKNEQESSKKETPILERSIMLTRFKLSQQKRKLREKDNSLSLITQALKRCYPSPKSAATKKQTTAQKSTPKSNKEKVEKVELYPNKLKRNKAVKKIMLKSKNELKVIGWSGVKRKRKGSQKNMKPQNIKRNKKYHKQSISLLNSSYKDNRSQSPVYSELGFEEVIRMADEGQDLDDEDLMEILTCPSPVWWEDPPDGEYMEGPIVIKTNPITSLPNLPPKPRCKQSRKRTPQKMIIESVECKSNDSNSIDIVSLDTKFINNKTSDVKFNKKRTKLEGLLSTIKTKRKELRDRQDNEILAKETVLSKVFAEEDKQSNVDVSSMKGESDSTPDLSGDSAFLDISLLDNDGLKHLENITIPMEGKNEKIIEQKVKLNNERNIANSVPLKPKTFTKEHFKMLTEDNSKNIPKIKSNDLKILDVKKVSRGLFLTLKSRQELKITQISNTTREKQSTVKNDSQDKETCSFNSYLNVDNFDKEVEQTNEAKTNNSSSLETEDRSRNYKDLSNNETSLKSVNDEIIPNEDVEYVTVFEIINSDDDETEENGESAESNDAEIAIDRPAAKESTMGEIDKNKLNSYYKKCKNSKRSHKKSNKVNNEGSYCDIDTKSSIMVPSTDDVKYCLNCSSIFDADICIYCVKKQEQKRKRNE